MKVVFRSSLRHQRGLGLPTAIFVITVMALLAVAVNRLVVVTSRSSSEAIVQAHALHAAESGAGLALNALFPPAEYPDYSSGVCPGFSTAPPFTFNTPGLVGCEATVSCEHREVDDTSFYTIVSTGTCGDVRREVEVRAVDEP